MIIEKPYDQLKVIKSKIREMHRDLADLELIVSTMQDYIVDNLENIIDDLQRKLDGKGNAEKFEKMLFNKEK